MPGGGFISFSLVTSTAIGFSLGLATGLFRVLVLETGGGQLGAHVVDVQSQLSGGESLAIDRFLFHARFAICHDVEHGPAWHHDDAVVVGDDDIAGVDEARRRTRWER
jgi:hypothetical protein